MPKQPGAAELESAQDLFARGHLSRAAEACARALKLDPGNYEAEHLTVQILLERGQVAFALFPLHRLAARRPTDPGLRVSLAAASRVTNDFDAAHAAVSEALELDPQHVGARAELVTLLLEQGARDEAVEETDRLVAEHPDDADAAFARARALAATGRPDAARGAFRRATELDAAISHRLVRLANGFRALRDEERARRALEEGAILQPEDPEIAHLVAAARGEADDTRVPDAYIVQHFDQFAELFDKRLKEDLRYTVPEDLVARVEPLVGSAREVLDAGCGTGLCGPLLRPLAKRLVGVDLSPGMLARARERGVYDELHEAELTAYLREHPESFDVLMAADVFIYFGDLSEIIALAAAAIRPGGVVAFSVERAAAKRTLASSGRWAHTPEEVLEVSAAAGLEVEATEAALRFEQGVPVEGLLVVGRRQAP
jgi:predicted TPR repeat methyltransferase